MTCCCGKASQLCAVGLGKIYSGKDGMSQQLCRKLNLQLVFNNSHVMIVDEEEFRVKLCLRRPEKPRQLEDSTGALASLLGKAWGS